MIAILGDIHFASSKDWLERVSEEFLKWFKGWERNCKGNSLILAGDLVHTSVNGGTVISYLEEFVTSSRFDDIYICVGNHDKKMTNGKEQLAYEFFKLKPHVHVYESDALVEIEGKNVLMLPYYLGTNDLGLTMSEWYSDMPRHAVYSNLDLVVGHFCGEDNSFPGAIDCVYNLDSFDTKKICLGHVHTRNVNPDRYIGSVYAGRVSENDYTRSAWILDGDTWTEERLPLFNEFLSVKYPDPLPESNAIVPIYTILNCTSEAIAREKYGDIYIRKTTASDVDVSSNKKYDVSRTLASIKDMDMKELLEAFLKDTEKAIPENVADECRMMLSKF